MDIFIDGLEIYAYHGVLAEEKTLGQPFRFDLRLGLESCLGASTDRVADTVDYSAVVDAVIEVVTSTNFDLLERLVCAVGEAVLARFAVEEVWVRVDKLRPPIPATLRSVGVAVTMRRPDASSAG
jgi:dihydroneopterin aldolase